MIMTDQDQDGSHIKGLIMNFMHHFYPSLLQVPGFMVEFITPIVKVSATCSLSSMHERIDWAFQSIPCTLQATKARQTKVFYTLPEYEAWRESVGSTRGWSIKYYKGMAKIYPFKCNVILYK